MRRRIIEVNVGEQGNVPKLGWLTRAYLWACERLYAELAWAYDWVSWLVSLGQWRRWQASVWREVRGQDVLEIGCGTGAMVVAGDALGLRVVGIDRSPAMLAVAQRRVARANGPLPLLQGDGRMLPFGDQSFDSAMATFPAGYIFEKDTLTEIRRVLRDGGRLVIVGLWVEAHLGMVARWIPLFYGRPSAARLQNMAQRVAEAGFRVRWADQRAGWFTVGVLVAERV